VSYKNAKDITATDLYASVQNSATDSFNVVIDGTGELKYISGENVPCFGEIKGDFIDFIDGFKCPTLSAVELLSRLKRDKITQQRRVISQLDAFCADTPNKMLGLYGLRRTGKSVMMRSKALELMKAGKRVVYFDFEQPNNVKKATWGDLLEDLKRCRELHLHYVFIDEVTWIVDEVTAELSGIKYRIPQFPLRGMEIYAQTTLNGIDCIVSGTDSYALSLASDSALFDRIKFLHTTHIPYAEYVETVGDRTVMEFIQDGGVFPVGGAYTLWSSYVETSLIENVMNSIQAIPTNRGKFEFVRRLKDSEIKTLLIYALALTEIEFVERAFLRPFPYTEFLEGVDLAQKFRHAVTREYTPVTFSDEFKEKVKEKIREKIGFTHLNEVDLAYVVKEMEEVLLDLDVIIPYKLYTVRASKQYGEYIGEKKVYALSLPGLRHYQLNATLESVREVVDEQTRHEYREILQSKIHENVEGYLLEGLIITETVRHVAGGGYVIDSYHGHKGYDVVQYRLYNNEVDMAVRNRETGEVSLFEVKRSDKSDIRQARHFVESEFIANFKVQHPNTVIKGCYVLYNGETTSAQVFIHARTGDAISVQHVNVRDYLMDIAKYL
jgi:predicted AAA+ superfamily ATPase